MTTSKVAIVIPALNEEEAIRQLLAELPRDLAEWVLVVDNGSTDDTARIARAGGALVASEPVRGYGRACHTGFQKACELGAEIVVFMDGDGSDDPADLPAMLAPVLEGDVEMTIGSRITRRAERGAVPPQAMFGNWLVGGLLRLFYGVQVRDIGSFRVIRCTTLKELHMHEMTFGWPVEMLIKMAQAHHSVLELPIHYRHRRQGHSKISGSVVGGVKAAYCMLRTTARYAWRQGETHV